MNVIWIAFVEDTWYTRAIETPWKRSLAKALLPSFWTRPIPERCEIVIQAPCTRSSRGVCDYCTKERSKQVIRTVHYVTFAVNAEDKVFFTAGKHTITHDQPFKYVRIDTTQYKTIDHDVRLKLLEFLHSQVGKPFNMDRYPGTENFIKLFFGVSTEGASWDDTPDQLMERPMWFCSEMITAALLYAGLDDVLPTINPKDVTPAILKRMLLDRIPGAKQVKQTDMQKQWSKAQKGKDRTGIA